MSAIDFRRLEGRGYPGVRGRYPVAPKARPAVNLLPGQVAVRIYSPSGKRLRTVAGWLLPDGRARVTWREEEHVAGQVRGWHVFKIPGRAER